MQRHNKRPRITYLAVISLSAYVILSAFFSGLLAENNRYSPVSAVSYTDRQKISIGERVRYTTTVSADDDTEVEFPPNLDKLGNFEVMDSGIISRTKGPRNYISRWYMLAIYQTGEQLIPELRIRYRRRESPEWESILSNKVALKVESVFEKGMITNDIKDIEPPIKFLQEYRADIIKGSLALISLIAILFLIIKKRIDFLRQMRLGPAADEIAYQRLDKFILSISGKSKTAKGDFIDIAYLTRDYLDKRYSLKAAALTTEEFLGRIKNIKEFFLRYGESLGGFLKKADLVKFANHGLSAEEMAGGIRAIKKMIDDIRREQ